jgi:hypothetical protein
MELTEEDGSVVPASFMSSIDAQASVVSRSGPESQSVAPYPRTPTRRSRRSNLSLLFNMVKDSGLFWTSTNLSITQWEGSVAHFRLEGNGPYTLEQFLEALAGAFIA